MRYVIKRKIYVQYFPEDYFSNHQYLHFGKLSEEKQFKENEVLFDGHLDVSPEVDSLFYISDKEEYVKIKSVSLASENYFICTAYDETVRDGRTYNRAEIFHRGYLKKQKEIEEIESKKKDSENKTNSNKITFFKRRKDMEIKKILKELIWFR